MIMVLLASFSVAAMAAEPAQPRLAAEPKPIVITVERTLPDGKIESWQVNFSGKEARIVTNSNFMDEPGAQGSIGFFSAPMNPRLRTEWLAMSQLRARRERESKTAAGLGLSVVSRPPVHSMRFKIGTDVLPSGSPFVAPIQDLIERLPFEAKWKAERVVRVEWRTSDSDFGAAFEGQSPGKLQRPNCHSEGRLLSFQGKGEKFSCVIPTYGTVYVLR